MPAIRTLILGAAGRDFHDFNVCYRDDPGHRVVAFTAAQIPDIEGRTYPAALAGPHYPDGIPIHAESEMEELIARMRVDEAVLAYSDLSHLDVMHLASRVLAAGADFRLHGPKRTQLVPAKPVVSVCAVRTGAGKSPVSRLVTRILKGLGRKVAVVRHPMPYGDLARQAAQRFASFADLDREQCTIEEREEYEPHLEEGSVVFAGVDYERILRLAEQEGDVVLWDGGNNDLPFFVPDFHIVVADPHRPGHELAYHPGEANARLADVFVINKVDSARPEDVRTVRANLRTLNPSAPVVEAASEIVVRGGADLRGKRVVAVEDGPTLTHGGMPFGAAWLAATRHGAVIVDPRPHAVGSLQEAYRRYPALGPVLPAMGYGAAMIADLERTINATEADFVLLGTPADLGRFLRLDKPALRVAYEAKEIGRPTLEELLRERFEPRD